MPRWIGFLKTSNPDKVINFYWGLGTELGVSGGNIEMTYRLNLMEEDRIFNYKLKTAFHNRYFFEAGMSICFFKKLELGFKRN